MAQVSPSAKNMDQLLESGWVSCLVHLGNESARYQLYKIARESMALQMVDVITDVQSPSIPWEK